MLFKTFPQKGQLLAKMSEKCISCAFVRIVPEIWGPIGESRRFGLYLGDSWSWR